MNNSETITALENDLARLNESRLSLITECSRLGAVILDLHSQSLQVARSAGDEYKGYVAFMENFTKLEEAAANERIGEEDDERVDTGDTSV